MKRVALIIALSFSTLSTQAGLRKAEHLYLKSKDRNRYAYIAQELYKSRYYFSATSFLKKHLTEARTYNKDLESLLEKLILKTGTDSFVTLRGRVLAKYRSPSLSFLYGIKLFKQNKLKLSEKYLRKVRPGHKFAPEAFLTLASIYNIQKNESKAKATYKQCIDMAKEKSKSTKKEKLSRYYDILEETCIIHTARLEYNLGRFDEALRLYDSIPKTSYRWPYILIEKAWTTYKLNDHNRSLGLLVTYKSPLLSSYFFPEAEILTALNYFKMCLWQDTLSKVEQYYTVYKSKSDELKKILVKNKNSHTFFLKMIMSPIKQSEGIHPFIRNLLTQIRKKIIFSIDLVNYKRAQNEKNYVMKLKSSEFNNLLKNEIRRILSQRTKKINHFVKRIMFNFINEIYKFSYEMFNIKLEILSKKRELEYRNKSLVSNRARGSHENLNRNEFQHFWDFEGAFWADELGEYSFGLKSNCEIVGKKKKQEDSDD